MKRILFLTALLIGIGSFEASSQFIDPSVFHPSNMTFIFTPGTSNPTPSTPTPATTTTPSSTSTPNGSGTSTHQCRVCGGKGEIISEVWNGSAPDKWCSKCGKSVYPSHTHKRCGTCNGTGRVANY